MLISIPNSLMTDPILAMIASVGGRSSESIELRKGVYEVGYFGSSGFLRDFEHYPQTSVGSYGVCDNAEQLLAACPELESSDRKFVVTLTRIDKANEPADGGWRWHKWGEYIGTQEPTREYIHDEPHIERVYCFHIYERV